MDEYAVCEGDELSQCVGNGVVECVVYFDVFDHASGAGRKAHGAQKEDQKRFHNVKKRLEIKSAKGSRSNARHKLKGVESWSRSVRETRNIGCFSMRFRQK